MIEAQRQRVLRFLMVVHRAPKAAGLEELARAYAGAPDARTLYRWQRSLDLTYFPNVSFRALGLQHLHLFIDDPAPSWPAFPYAVSAEWVTQTPGRRTLYLHCLVPTIHAVEVEEVIASLSGTYTRIASLTTIDSWQTIRDLTSAATSMDPVPAAVLAPATRSVWEVVERVPLLLPVIFETVGQRRSLPAVWHQIYARLGPRVWEYLPRGAHRLPINGKTYVKDAYALLNHTALFRQNIIRSGTLTEASTSMYLHVEDEEITRIIDAFASRAALLDVHPLTTRGALLRITASPEDAKALLSATSILPPIRCSYFVDELATAPAVRFAYELLFDPRTTEWQFPRAEIRRRVTPEAA
jgi:hypothetical protein